MSSNITNTADATGTDEYSGEGSSAPQLAEGVVQLINAVVKGVERQIEPAGLISMEFSILKSFAEKSEWTVTQLADVLPADAPRISRLVSKLVDRGLLRRRRRTDDRRVVLLRLTQQGKDLSDELRQRVNEHESRLLEGVSPEELETLRAVTSKILANHATMEQSRGR